MAKSRIYIPTYISSVTYAPARVLPHIYFYNGTRECDQYYIQGKDGISKSYGVFPYFDNYSGNTPTTESLSLLFNNETAVYGETPTASLYSEYWETYMNLLYNPKTRVLNCDAIIPLADYFKMELNDVIEFRGNYYHLRAINDYNLANGECKLQLLGPLLNDVIANVLPGLKCNFNFDSAIVTTTTAGPTTTTTSTTSTTTTLAPTTTTTTTAGPTTTTTAGPTTTSTTTTTLAPTTTTTTAAGTTTTTSTTSTTTTTIAPTTTTTTTALPAGSPVVFTINYNTIGTPYIQTSYQTGSNANIITVQNSADLSNWIDTAYSHTASSDIMRTLNNGQQVLSSYESGISIPTGSYWRLKQTNNDNSIYYSTALLLSGSVKYEAYTCGGVYGYTQKNVNSINGEGTDNAGQPWSAGSPFTPGICYQIIKYITYTTGSLYTAGTIPASCTASSCI